MLNKINSARHQKNNWIILSLGGSLIVPDSIAVTYLIKLRRTLLSLKGFRFVIVCGGGATSRRYIKAAREAGAHPKNGDLDWVGIRSLMLNAELVRLVFGKAAAPNVLTNAEQYRGVIPYKIIVAGAKEIGSSSDLNAVKWARRLAAKTVINLTNINFVYSANPKLYPKASPLKNISWNEYLKIIGRRWSPGLDTPFDPIASIYAKHHGLTAIIINGKKITEVARAIKGEKFSGTTIC